MKTITISVHHEGVFTYDPFEYTKGDVDECSNIDLGKMNHSRLMHIIKECCTFPVEGRNSTSLRDDKLEDNEVDEKFKVNEGDVYPVHDPNAAWNEMNDYIRMVVLCGRNVKEGRFSSQKGKQNVDEDKGASNDKGKQKVEEGSKSKPVRGELLTTMGRDVNNQMFPMASAVMGIENNEN
nr:zinc finger BED domain-containing protein RICESLEEPER 2 [Tanacetum cinerariifolium]